MFIRTCLPWLALCQLVSLGQLSHQPSAAEPLPSESTTSNADSAAASPPHVSLITPASAGGLKSDGTSVPTTASMLAESLGSEVLKELAMEILDRNPEIARADRLAAIAATRAPQLRALPDPVASLSFFALPAETRAGPQRWSASIQQKLPWFGKLALKEQAALFVAAAAQAEAEEARLEQLTELRRLVHELAFSAAYETIVANERSTLVRYEKTAQARYAAGTGLQQEIVRIQAQITRVDTILLETAERRIQLTASVNRLRDRPSSSPLGELPGNDPAEPHFDGELLRQWASAGRSQLAAAEARIAAAGALIELAEKNFRPDLTLGLSFTSVDSRNDREGRLQPPEDNGDDILKLTGSLNLPVYKSKLNAGLREAQESRWAAEEMKRAVGADIENAIGDLTARMPLMWQHLSLLETVLLKQAQEALRSAETAYRTGRLNAIDLLDAEVVLFEVQIAAARARTDLAVAWALLERTVGRSVRSLQGEVDS